MAKQSITLDELLTAMKGAKIKYEKTLLASMGSATTETFTLPHPITDYDFISIEAGDDVDNNPDNTLSLRLVDSITYKRHYADVGCDTDGGTPGNGSGINNAAAAWIGFMFLDATTFKVIYQHNHYLKRMYGWKSTIEWGGGYCRLVKDYIASVFARGCLLWHKLV